MEHNASALCGNVGRSIEAMLCAMLGEPVGTSTIEKVVYGDNLAAIGIASGTGGTSWRTRHLRIRASYVKEALDGTAPGGPWRLIHLSGKELVAHGMTKPLQGQAFASFLTDLGMLRPSQHEGGGPQDHEISNAAVMAMMTGSSVLSGVDSEEGGDGEADSEITWICGAVLMVLGAVYTSQIAVDGVRCCLKRLRVPMRPKEEGSRRNSFEDSDSGCETSVKVKRGKGSSSNRNSLSLSIRTQSGFQHDSSAAADNDVAAVGSESGAASSSTSSTADRSTAAERSTAAG